MSKKRVFSFLLSKEKNIDYGAQKCFWGKYIICYDKCTPMTVATIRDSELLIFGLAIDVRNGEYDFLAESILEKAETVFDVIEYEKSLGGKYILFYRCGEEYYVIPDATASVPFCYTVSKSDLVCGTNPEKIAQLLGLSPDLELLNMRYSGEMSQAMPYDLTVYKEVKQLLPNHYFDFQKKEVCRIINSNVPQKKISAKEAVTITEPFIRNLTEFYVKQYDIFCPITGGMDSRVNLAFLMSVVGNASDLKCYTIQHDFFTGKEADLLIPKELHKEFKFDYTQIRDVKLSDKIIEEFDFELGQGRYSINALKIAETVRQYCKGGAVINGDIIGQIGKCSLHRDVPTFLATAGYFRCKLHNYSSLSKVALKQWKKEIKLSNEKVNIFDLFSIENRMGRWASQSNMVSNLLGQVNLNIFNSRSIIYEWTCVKRSSRMKADIHFNFLSLLNEKLLSVPFGNDGSLAVKISKCNGLFFYFASYSKYLIGKVKFILRRRV